MKRLEDLHHRLNADKISVKTQWLTTRMAWRDPVGDRFEREFWQPLEDQVSRYLDALKELSDALNQADIKTR